MTTPSEKPQPSIIINEGAKMRVIALPDYGEVIISMHDGKVKYVDTRTREIIKNDLACFNGSPSKSGVIQRGS